MVDFFDKIFYNTFCKGMECSSEGDRLLWRRNDWWTERVLQVSCSVLCIFVNLKANFTPLDKLKIAKETCTVGKWLCVWLRSKAFYTFFLMEISARFYVYSWGGLSHPTLDLLLLIVFQVLRSWIYIQCKTLKPFYMQLFSLKTFL